MPHNDDVSARHDDGDRHRVLSTADGVRIDAVHHRAQGPVGVGPGLAAADLVFVLVHGFTGSSRTGHMRRIAERFSRFGAVVAIDQRGHGRSTGASTLGHDEVHDVAAAVDWARDLQYRRVVTVGFSLGGAIVVRHAGTATDSPVDAVVAVSAPAFWYYRGTRPTRTVHRFVLTRAGRLALRARGTHVSGAGWPDPLPASPVEAAGRLRVPLLVVHGDADRYFPVEHARALQVAAAASGAQSELWLERDLGHAERAVGPALVDRVGAWALGHAGGAAGS